jgi:hypothetical protein
VRRAALGFAAWAFLPIHASKINVHQFGDLAKTNPTFANATDVRAVLVA